MGALKANRKDLVVAQADVSTCTATASSRCACLRPERIDGARQHPRPIDAGESPMITLGNR
ncbi:MAG: hypothetical protein ACJ8GJ_03845, partial [Vitreoscilla sp.]